MRVPVQIIIVALVGIPAVSRAQTEDEAALAVDQAVCETRVSEQGTVSVREMLRTGLLCSSVPGACRGRIVEMAGEAEWYVSWCPMFEEGVALRFDPAPSNPAKNSFLVAGIRIGSMPAIIVRDSSNDSAVAAIGEVSARSAAELTGLIRRAQEN